MVNKIKHIICFIIVFIFFPFFTYAQQERNEFWLFTVPTAHTVQNKVSALDISWRFTQFGKRDPRRESGEILMNGVYGMTDRINIYAMLPYGWISSQDNGIADVILAVKYKLLENQSFKLSLFPRIALPLGDKKKHLGGDRINYEFNTNLSYQKSQYLFLLNMGYGYRSHLYPPRGEFSNQGAIEFSGGFMMNIMSSGSLIFEGIWKRVPRYTDDDLSLRFGGLLRVRHGFLLKGSFGFGLPRDRRANTDQQVLLGLCYYFSK